MFLARYAGDNYIMTKAILGAKTLNLPILPILPKCHGILTRS